MNFKANLLAIVASKYRRVYGKIAFLEIYFMEGYCQGLSAY